MSDQLPQSDELLLELLTWLIRLAIGAVGLIAAGYLFHLGWGILR